ncbi:hypothetical protein [Saccharopolyspora spinosa]|uniref:hypothetical protein n=1 Tax=Saccharopolyspora spinosa TaxID=60894 RepID=UPI00376EE468
MELAQLRSKVAGRGRKKKALDVTEAGVGGALVADRGVGLEGCQGGLGLIRTTGTGGRLMSIWTRGLLGRWRM